MTLAAKELVLTDANTGERLLRPLEAREEHRQAEARAKAYEVARERAEARARAEEEARQKAEAEIERLRQEIDRLRRGLTE